MEFKSKYFALVVVICILFCISTVYAGDNQTEMLAEDMDYHSFEELNQSISQASSELNLTYDYKYDSGKIRIGKVDEFVINGNAHVIEGVSNCEAFDIDSGNKVIINNLTFRNCNNMSFQISSPLVFNDVRFINCSGTQNNNFLWGFGELTVNNCVFQMKNGTYNVIRADGPLTIINSCFDGEDIGGSIMSVNRVNLIIENSTFENFTSNMATALNYKGCNLTIIKSRFSNLQARLSGGAIIGKYFKVYDVTDGNVAIHPFLIENCEFINCTSTNDGGAIYFDLDSGSDHIKKSLNIVESNFTNCSSRFGGALAIQGGILNIIGSDFADNFASFEGGALFTTWANVNMLNSSLIGNVAEKNAGAIYFDKGKLTIKQSNLTNNNALKESASAAYCIYAHDVDAYFANSTFDNGGISVYADFAADSKMENITKNNDIFLMDNKNYMVSVESNGIRLNLTNNSIVVDKFPSRYDMRDWGWVTPVKRQGDNDDCWAFATVASLESSLLKATGLAYDLSANYVQKLQLKYHPVGDLRISLTGFAYSGLGYALSWYGVLPSDSPYDDRGMISDTDLGDGRIHVQDAMIIFGGRNDTNDLIKQAVLKYGPVAIQICADYPVDDLVTAGDDIAVMDHGIHFISIIGWDDNYSIGSNVGAWICKDSLGDFNYRFYDDEEILGKDYYAIVTQNAGICYIFENDIDYHVNYQTDLTGLTGFDGNYTYYSNEFTSKYSELIGAVGTYFNESGINYSFDIYVNGIKVHSQSGVSEFAGFRTIVLNKYIKVNEGDKFKVVFKNNNLPYQAYSRVHYIQGMSLISKDGGSWEDITLENKTVCLKVYTVADDAIITGNKDIAVDYDGGKFFSVNVVTADGIAVVGASVKFTINGKTTIVKTDSNGIAKIKITDVPKKYAMTTSFNGKTYKNTVTVNQILTASKVTVKKTAKKFTLKATLKINGKLVKGKTITFKFKGKTYTVKVTYLKDTIKSSVKIK